MKKEDNDQGLGDTVDLREPLPPPTRIHLEIIIENRS
ncbi:hypothetical protein Bhyg_17089 [Pseudolycoriella hygida]|uniref:Uncharacterized protein n=1 Tax=Pseudolycoriella hygida TaxID=35572 RepID=A0A9Q0RSV8_9DIPT|nr:hypothetical protein Bhyg_17089 [Pseudolycoriella hygida]